MYPSILLTTFKFVDQPLLQHVKFIEHTKNLSRHKLKILPEIQAISNVTYLKHNSIQQDKIPLSP